MDRNLLTLESRTTSGTIALCLLGILATSPSAQTYKYDFGPGKVASGFTQVQSNTMYSSSSGYGFEPGARITCVDRGGSDALISDFCTTTDTTFEFSVKVPQGNYNATIHFGDISGTSETTIQAESHRYLFDRVTTSSGQTVAKTITVNMRTPTSIDGTVTMSTTAREMTYLTWDNKLTFRFYGRKMAVAGIELTKVSDAITVFLCGNSTVVDMPDTLSEGRASWGQMIPCLFKPGVSIANYAESGLTSTSFLGMKRLDKIMADAKAGDYVFVEFGHNDQKTASDVTNYPAHLKTFYDQIVAKKAIPVFVAPTARMADTDPTTSIAGLAQVMRNTAKSLGATLIDLNAMTIQLNNALGANKKYVYVDAVTHFTYYGAFELARCVARSISQLNNSLTPFLLNDLPVFDPTKPDPINYLTTAGTPTGIALRGNSASQAQTFSIHGNRVEYSASPEGNTEFVLYALDGHAVLSRPVPAGLDRGALNWSALGAVPNGIYLVAMKTNGITTAQAKFCKM